jgi:UDP-N-acetylmuramoyl-L-alanyl-D-glutamate--2,6-diaminopimelate ligase
VTEYRLSELSALLEHHGLLLSEASSTDTGTADPGIAAVRYDSRLVGPGDLFVARRGQRADGHEHVAAAARAGAAAAIVERPVSGVAVPQLVVTDAKAGLGLAAAWRAGDPSRSLGVVGITGTDGKTTTAYLVRAILDATGLPAGLVGTTDVIVAGESLGNAARTSTPEAPELQAHLAAMLHKGDRWAVIESTSHGLAQQRVEGVAYDIAVLTNVTSEHLEFHGTLEAYRAAKRSLFERLAISDGNPDKGWGKHAIVNADDPECEAVAHVAAEAGARVLRYGLAGGLADRGERDLALAATSLLETPSGMRIDMVAGDRSFSLTLRLAGRFNVHNALAAMGVAVALDLDIDVAADALGRLDAVPGRMQRIDEGQAFSVVIDYAHTAESLAKVLDELAPIDPDAGLIAVFGSAGDRDPSKREPMGRAAGKRCRIVIVTDEDPRGEDRMAILESIAAGAEQAGRRRGQDLLLIPDRAEAIATALWLARPGDAVLVAGKGHEKTIEMADREIAWDEARVVREALRG